MISPLLLLLEGLILLTLGSDLSDHFGSLAPWNRSVLLALGALGGLVLLVPGVRIRIGPVLRAPLAVLSCITVLLAGCGILADVLERRIAGSWDAGARDRLERRALLLQEDFEGILAEIPGPLERTGSAIKDRREAFGALERAMDSSNLPHERIGYSIYDRGGGLVAWAGNSSQAPEDLVGRPGPGRAFRVAGEVVPRLYVSLPSDEGDDATRRVAEYVLRSAPRLGVEMPGTAFSLDSLPHWRRIVPAHVHFRSGSSSSEELGLFFERSGDRHWSRLEREGILTLSIPLRSPDGESLAVATLKDIRAPRAIREMHRTLRAAAALLTATGILIVLILFAPAARLGSGPRRLLILSISLWAFRWFLLLPYDTASLPDWSVYDITIYASMSLFGLLRTPADLLLTSLTLLAQATLILREIRATPRPVVPARRSLVFRFALTGGLLTVIAGWVGLHRFLDRVVIDARLDITRLALDEHSLSRLAIQVSLLCITTALAFIAVALGDLALRCSPSGRSVSRLRWFSAGSPERLPLPVRLFMALILLTLFYVPSLHHAYDRLRRQFFEFDLMPALLHQGEARERILGESLDFASGPDFATDAIFALDAGDGNSSAIAYRLWTMTPLARRGLASSLRIFDDSGRLLDHFAADFAPMLDIPFDDAVAAAGGPPLIDEPPPDATIRKRVLFGSRWVNAPRRPPLLVVLATIDEYENPPMLAGGTIDFQLLANRGLPATNPELVRFDPLVAVFGPTLETLYESGGEIPPPGPGLLRELEKGRPVWSSRLLGDDPARVLYARGTDAVYALAMSHPGPLGLIAAFLRLLLLNGLLVGALFAVIGGVRIIFFFGARGSGRPVTSFYARLVLLFLVSAPIPLLVLATFFSRFSAQEFTNHTTTVGLGALQVARRIAEDYLRVSSTGAPSRLDDDVVFWLSRVVGQNISIYDDSQLIATSTRGLYGSGLIDTRLRGDVYRAIYLDRDPYLVTRSLTGDPHSLTIHAPLGIDPAGTTGVISIPLEAQRRAAVRRIDSLRDVILISTFLTVLLLAAVGWLVARSVSQPISRLSRAARRLAGGDLDVRVPASGHDELGALIEAFNRMADSLRGQREDLQKRKDYIEMILNSATTGVVSTDAHGAVITVNPAAQRLLAGGHGPLTIGDDLAERLSGDPSYEPLYAALARGGPGGGDAGVELAIPRDGGERRLRAVFLPFSPVQGAPPGRIILLEDVTEVVRSGRLAAWADMARRIAHDVKNPLTPIQLSVQHVQRLWEAGDPKFGEVLVECLGNIQDQVRTLHTIASEFSAYARLPQLKTAPTPVTDLIDEALKAYAAAPPPGTTLHREVEKGLPDLQVDGAVIVRVLVNLVENALQAMPDGGSLTVAAMTDAGSARGRQVRVEVRDTGRGIDPATIPHLFEPYFSTRSGGTGLGLAIAHRAVEEHGGSISIRSKPGGGTIVAMTLPAVTTGSGRVKR